MQNVINFRKSRIWQKQGCMYMRNDSGTHSLISGSNLVENGFM